MNDLEQPENPLTGEHSVQVINFNFGICGNKIYRLIK